MSVIRQVTNRSEIAEQQAVIHMKKGIRTAIKTSANVI